MFVCLCVCMYVCMYAHVCMCVCVRMLACLCVWLSVCTYVAGCMAVCRYVSTCVCRCGYMSGCICMHAYMSGWLMVGMCVFKFAYTFEMFRCFTMQFKWYVMLTCVTFAFTRWMIIMAHSCVSQTLRMTPNSCFSGTLHDTYDYTDNLFSQIPGYNCWCL